MQYLGGKSRISKAISGIINETSKYSCSNFVSLFCGTCSIESKIKGFDSITCNDNHEYLIAMLNAVQNGYNLPETISEEQYKYIRNHKDEDKALAGFVGFGCSFGGKWFGGYAKNKAGTNYALQSKKSLLKDMDKLHDAKFICKDYRDVTIPDNSVVYADPPYANTTRYSGGSFDTNEFWDYMRKISEKNIVFISEQNAPEDFIKVWEKPCVRTLDKNKSNQFVVTEKLFVHKHGLYNKILTVQN